MMTDRLAIEAPRMAGPLEKAGAPAGRCRPRSAEFFGDAHHLARLAFDIEFFLDVMARELAHTWIEERDEHFWRADGDGDARLDGRRNGRAVPQADAERQAQFPDAAFETVDELRFHLVVNA